MNRMSDRALDKKILIAGIAAVLIIAVVITVIFVASGKRTDSGKNVTDKAISDTNEMVNENSNENGIENGNENGMDASADDRIQDRADNAGADSPGEGAAEDNADYITEQEENNGDGSNNDDDTNHNGDGSNDNGDSINEDETGSIDTSSDGNSVYETERIEIR